MSDRPNYRIYDRTGGCATEDIYAESLEDAIRQGREWIEAGDWGDWIDNDEDQDGNRVYRVDMTLGVRGRRHRVSA